MDHRRGDYLDDFHRHRPGVTGRPLSRALRDGSSPLAQDATFQQVAGLADATFRIADGEVDATAELL